MKNILIVTTLFLFTHCEPIPSQSSSSTKQLIYDNYDYEDIVGIGRILPFTNGELDYLGNPVIELADNSTSLDLQFDLVTGEFEYLAVKIYHCNKDWTKSMLRDMEYLNEINSYRITEYDYSLQTVKPYINYRFQIPKPRISGNYIVSVFRRNNPKDILLNRKFIAVENKVSIDQQVRQSTTVAKRDQNQQIDFNLNYGNLLVNSPTQDISVVLLQNHRWQDARRDIKPTLLRPNESYMEFRMLNLETNFYGWNEYRFFDLRTIDVTGRNVGRISVLTDQIDVRLGVDPSRAGQVFTQNLRDINGNYIIQSDDIGDVPLNADYANVRFYIKSGPINGNVYVTGRFNNWALTDENKMKYDPSNERYTTSLRLKQGYYDYQYLVDAPDTEPFLLEGSHFQAENDYEILVYYRKPGNVNDEVVGYKKFNSIPGN